MIKMQVQDGTLSPLSEEKDVVTDKWILISTETSYLYRLQLNLIVKKTKIVTTENIITMDVNLVPLFTMVITVYNVPVITIVTNVKSVSK